MGAELHIQEGEGNTRVVPLSGPITMGRGPECDLVVNDPEVSWKHCTLWVEHGVPWIRDLSSRNGTFVADARIQRATPLTEGVAIRLGAFEASIHGVTSLKATPVALALLDEKTGLSHVLRSDRFVVGTGRGADLRIEGVSATFVIHPEGEVWLDDEEIPLDTSHTLGPLAYRIVRVDAHRQPTVDAVTDRYPYQLAVDLNGATGPIAEVSDPKAGLLHTLDATNRAILLYVLAKRWSDDAESKVAETQRGWCTDDDLIVGVWGKAALADGTGKLKALLHRVRSELRDAGFDPWFLEKKRGYTRVRVARALV
jgi:pSer/pThr/pTyr-binding forkhead associated (FHA) protein